MQGSKREKEVLSHDVITSLIGAMSCYVVDAEFGIQRSDRKLAHKSIQLLSMAPLDNICAYI